MEIQVHLPPTDNDAISRALRKLTKAICDKYPDEHNGGFGLGGSYGYGCNFENDVFVMRMFYWGDCTCDMEARSEKWHSENPHSDTCYATKMDARFKAAGVDWDQSKGMDYDKRKKIRDLILKELCLEHGLTYPNGCMVHCDCGTRDRAQNADIGHRADCLLELPNFHHKASGLKVEWYKWIGRDNEISGPVERAVEVIKECIASI